MTIVEGCFFFGEIHWFNPPVNTTTETDGCVPDSVREAPARIVGVSEIGKIKFETEITTEALLVEVSHPSREHFFSPADDSAAPTFGSFGNLVRQMDDFRRALPIACIPEMFDALLSKVPTEAYQLAYSLVSLIYRLYNLRGVVDLAFAAFDFLISTLGLGYIRDKFEEVQVFITTAVREMRNSLCIAGALRGPLTEGSNADQLRFLRSRLSFVLESDVVTALKTFVLTLVSYKFFGKDQAHRIQKILGPARPCTVLELSENLLEATAAMVHFGERITSGEPLSQIFSAHDPGAAFLEEADQLILYEPLTYSGLPVEGHICRRSYLDRLTRTVADGNTLVASFPRAAPQRKALEAKLQRITLIKRDTYIKMCGEQRPFPMGIIIVGDPGIGKSSLIEFVSRLWSSVKGREYHSGYNYHRDPTSDYWEGYEPGSHPGIHLSEPGALHRNIAKAQGDPVMTETLRILDNQPMLANMAAVEKKGNVYVMPEYVVLDCNDESLNLEVLVNNPAAVRRRFVYIRPTVKPEFRKGEVRLDQRKALAADTPALDRWTFRVYRKEPVNCKDSDTITELADGDIYALTSHLRDRFKTHILEQEQVMAMKIDINDYLREEVRAEARDTLAVPPVRSVRTPPPIPPRPSRRAPRVSSWEKHMAAVPWQVWFVLMLLRAAWPVFLAFACMCGWGLAIIINWFWPYGLVQKVLGHRAAHSRFSHNQIIFSHHWQRFRATCGWSNSFSPVPPPSYNYGRYAAAFAGLLVVVRFFRTWTIMTEGSVLSTRVERTQEQVDAVVSDFETRASAARPTPVSKKGTANVWERSENRPTPVLIQEQNQLKPHHEIRATVMHNVRVVLCTGKDGSFETRALGVKDDLAIINRHSLKHPDQYGRWVLESSLDEEGKLSVIKTVITESELTAIRGDLMLVRLRGLKFRNILSYFPTTCVVTSMLRSSGYIGHTPTRVLSQRPVVAQDSRWGQVPIEAPLCYEWPDHAAGNCGSPLFLEYSSGLGVAGIHTGAIPGEPTSYSESISLAELSPAIAKLTASTTVLPINSEGKMRLPVGSKGFISPGLQSPLWFEEAPGLSIFGKIEGHSPPRLGRSKLTMSVFLPYAEELTGCSPYEEDGQPRFGAPHFSRVIRDGQYYHPFNHFVKKTGVIKESLNPQLLDIVVKTLSHHIIDGLRERGVSQLQPVPLAVAQNGDPDNYYYRAMKPSTSGGWAFPGPKKRWSTQCELEFKQEAYMPNIEVTEQVAEQLEAYGRGEDAMPLLGAQLKDEPRSWEKNKTAKTRVFCMSPYESTLVSRMYLMPFYTLMVQHSDVFYAALGINPHSYDVDQLVERLTSFASQFMEGDYGGYDTSMPYDVGLAANTVVYTVLKEFGYSEDALDVVRGILSDNLYPVVVMQGDVFAAPALQPSGKYATAEDNSLRGLIMLIYAWIVMCTSDGAKCSPEHNATSSYAPADFFKFVCPVVYGDDMLAAVKAEVRELYNNVTYQRFCAEVYGLEFTDAQKAAVMAPFLTFDQVSFLKRSFRFREDLDHWVAPLDRASIMKTISYYLPSRSVNLDDQMLDTCKSALRELFFHLSEEDYERTRCNFARIYASEFKSRTEQEILQQFPRFDSLVTEIYDHDGERLVSA
nr:MAG: putative polyprotein [Labyrnavirus sp.]